MIKPGQIIEITLVRPNMVTEYQEKGYDGKVGQKIKVKAEDLSMSSHKKFIISVIIVERNLKELYILIHALKLNIIIKMRVLNVVVQSVQKKLV